MDKKQIKEMLAEKIQHKFDVYKDSKLFLKFWRRVNTICRSQINRLSYELKYDSTKIYLVRDGRERIIECKSHEEYWSKLAFNNAKELLTSILAVKEN